MKKEDCKIIGKAFLVTTVIASVGIAVQKLFGGFGLFSVMVQLVALSIYELKKKF